MWFEVEVVYEEDWFETQKDMKLNEINDRDLRNNFLRD